LYWTLAERRFQVKVKQLVEGWLLIDTDKGAFIAYSAAPGKEALDCDGKK
jgi:hypothetical protein